MANLRSLNTALYEMKKSNLILRETNGFNVSNGATRHRGFEYEATLDACALGRAADGTVARHEYDFSRAVEGGETIVDGNDVDTAPRNVHSLSSGLELGSLSDLDEWHLVLEGTHVGQLLPRRREHRDLSRARRGESAAGVEFGQDRCARTCASTIFSTSAMPTAQTSLSATTVISRPAGARYFCQSTTPAN